MKKEIKDFSEYNFEALNLYIYFYVMMVNHGLFPWDLGYGHNEEWLNLIPLLDSIEREMQLWYKEKEEQEKEDNSNAIPKKEKKSIKDMVLGSNDNNAEKEISQNKNREKTSSKTHKEREEKKQTIEIPLPWRNSKEKAQSIRKMLHF